MSAFWNALKWSRAMQLKAPVSNHHERAVKELWEWLESLELKTALEIGAGQPPYLTARLLRAYGIKTVTIDAISKSDITADAHELPFKDDSFDLVVARHVLEHVLCPPVVLAEMWRTTKRYALVIVPHNSRKALLWPDHLWFLQREGWQRLFDKLGFHVLEFAIGDHSVRPQDEDLEWRYLLEI